VIDELSAIFVSPKGSWVKAGAEVSLTVAITGNSHPPIATLFDGTQTAVTSSMSSMYSFHYTIQAHDKGPVIFSVHAQDEAGNSAHAILDSSYIAGKIPWTGAFEFAYNTVRFAMVPVLKTFRLIIASRQYSAHGYRTTVHRPRAHVP